MKITHLTWDKVGAYKFHSKESAENAARKLGNKYSVHLVWDGEWGIQNSAGCWVNDFS